MNDVWIVEVLVVVLFALCCGALLIARRRGRLALASGGLLGIAAVVWAATAAAIVSETGGADGFVDCGSNCGAAEYLTAVGFLVPPLLAALGGVGLLVAIFDRGARRRRGRGAA